MNAASSSSSRRRAVLTPKPERPLGVAVITGFLWLICIAAIVAGISIIVAFSLDAAEDARSSDRFGRTTPADVMIASAIGGAIILAAVLLGWVGAANAAGRAWAWTAMTAGAIVLSVPVAIVAFSMFIIALEEGEEFILLALPLAAVVLAFLLVPRYYRRPDVRAFFGKSREAPKLYEAGRE